LFYKDLQDFYNVSKTYLRQWTLQKLPKKWNHRKTRKPFIYKVLQAYLPQHCLYLRPEPQGLLYWGFWQFLGALGSLIRHLATSQSTP